MAQAQVTDDVKSNDKNLRPIIEPFECKTKYDESDKKLLAKIQEKFGSKLDPLYPSVIRTFIIGYKTFDEREKETLERIEHYLKRFEEYNFNGCLKEPLENEEEMKKAWPVFTYGMTL